jgi:hypothetical protein
MGVGNLTAGGGLAGALRPQAIGHFGERSWDRQSWLGLGVCSNGRSGRRRRPDRRSTMWKLGALAHHGCRAAEQPEQSEDDQGALDARAPLPPAKISR